MADINGNGSGEKGKASGEKGKGSSDREVDNSAENFYLLPGN